MALEAKALETAVSGLVGIGIKTFGQFLEDQPLKAVEQQIYNWSETYTDKYLKRHGQIQVLGMSQAISLDDIYTNVRMLDAETVKCLESVEGLEQVYRKANQRGFGKKESAKQKGIEVANAEKYLCVLGGPGIGKTTYLRKVGLEALLREVGSYNHKKIPVFLELKRFRDPDIDIKKSISEEFETCGFPNPEKFTEHALIAGDLLILLDGLDEVPSGNFKKVVQAIKDFSDRYSKNRFITSCRIAAYNTYFTGFNTVAIAEFNDDQIFDFIANWFKADPNPQLTLEKKAEYAKTLWEQLKTSDSIGTKELSQTPLLLTFVCLVFRQKKTIIDNRAKLYEKALDILLEEWAKSKLLEENWEIYQDLYAELEKDMLASIAYVGFEEDKLFFEKDELAEQITAFLTDNFDAPKYLDANKVIDAIAVQQGIFIERATDIYSFSHLTLQEYLCADYIMKWNCEEQLIKNHATNERWREIFLLVTGLKGRAAIGFLKKLEVQTQELSENPKLKGLLAWVKNKTSTANSDYSGEIKRVFTLKLVFDLARALALAHDLGSDLAFARDRDLATDLGSDLAFARSRSIADAFATDLASALASDLASARGLASALARSRASALDRDRSRASKRSRASARSRSRASADALDRDRSRASKRARSHAKALDRDRSRASTSGKIALIEQLISDVNLQPLISYLDNSLEASKISAEKLTSIAISSLDISPEFFDLSEDDVQVFVSYLSTCQLMIDCRKQASGLSPKDWNVIQHRMFLPP